MKTDREPLSSFSIFRTIQKSRRWLNPGCLPSTPSIEMHPVMAPADLMKADTDIEAAVKKYS